jgi:hypothetical protein
VATHRSPVNEVMDDVMSQVVVTGTEHDGLLVGVYPDHRAEVDRMLMVPIHFGRLGSVVESSHARRADLAHFGMKWRLSRSL